MFLFLGLMFIMHVFYIYICLAQLNMPYVEKRYRNKITVIL